MQIRREDKEFINYMKLIGAGVGAILAVLVVFNFHRNAKNQLYQQRQYVKQSAPILALENSQLIEDLGSAANIAGGFFDNAKQANAQLGQLENSFWAALNFTSLMVLCAIACVGGLIGGYCSVWLISAISTTGTIKLIRLTYRIIWRIKPDFDGGRQKRQDGENILIKRDSQRVLPGIIKLSVMGVIGLTIFWIVLYYYTR